MTYRSNKRLVLDDKFEYYPELLIARGLNGNIYAGRDISNPSMNYAIKFENSLLSNKLKLEKEIYEVMYGIEGFPTCHGIGSNKTSNYLVMDRLGPSLGELFKYCNNHFSLQTILLIGIQALTRLQDLHSKSGFIIGDVTPSNFLIGTSQTNLIYLVDFGCAKPFRFFNETTSKIEHIAYKDNNVSSNGTINIFSSINQHMNIETSRRDDLESLGYMLIYFANKGLPWENNTSTSNTAITEEENNNKILEKKMSIPVEVYCKELPIEFSIYMNYVYSLRFGEKPDYNYLKSLLARLLFSYYIAKFYFDWNLLQPKEVPANLRINKEIDNKYLFKSDSDNKDGALSLVSSVNHHHNRHNDDSNEEDEEEEDEESDEDDKSSNDNGSKGKEEMCNDNNNNNKHNGDEESSVLISSSNIHNSNAERNEDSDDDDDGTNKTEQNSFFNDEEFLEMFTEINHAPKGRKVAPKYAGVAPLNINLKNINNQNTPFNHNLHIKKKQNNNSNNNINHNSSSHINTNTNDDLLLKSRRSGVSLASLSSERNLLHNNNNNNNIVNPKHKGKLIKLNQHINDNIKEEDEDGTASKR